MSGEQAICTGGVALSDVGRHRDCGAPYLSAQLESLFERKTLGQSIAVDGECHIAASQASRSLNDRIGEFIDVSAS